MQVVGAAEAEEQQGGSLDSEEQPKVVQTDSLHKAAGRRGAWLGWNEENKYFGVFCLLMSALSIQSLKPTWDGDGRQIGKDGAKIHVQQNVHLKKNWDKIWKK